MASDPGWLPKRAEGFLAEGAQEAVKNSQFRMSVTKNETSLT